MKRASLLIDEPYVLNVVRSMLEHHGFAVEGFAACLQPGLPHECELGCRTEHAAPDLIVVEILLPRCCTGVDAARKALRQWPGVKVLLTSASPREMWPEDAVNAFASLPAMSCGFLAKPFTTQQLYAAIDDLLNGRH